MADGSPHNWTQIWWAGTYYCGSSRSGLQTALIPMSLASYFSVDGWWWPFYYLNICIFSMESYSRVSSHRTHFPNGTNKTTDADWEVAGKPEPQFLPWLHSVQALLQGTGGRSDFGHRIWILYLQCSQEVPLCNREPALTPAVDSPPGQIFLLHYTLLLNMNVDCVTGN